MDKDNAEVVRRGEDQRASAKGDARGVGKCGEGGGAVEERGFVRAENCGAGWVRLANDLWKGYNHLVLADSE